MSRSVIQTGTLNTAPESATYGASAIPAQALQAMNAKALMRANYALATASTAPCNILFAGHSMVEGYTSVNMADRFADSTVTALRRRLGISGGLGHKKMSKAATLAGYPIALTGALGASGYGMGGSSAAWIGATWGPHTITIPAGSTSVDICWNRGNSSNGSFSWALDGGSATTISGAGATSGYQVTNVVTNPATSHSLVLAYVSGQIAVSGITFYAGDETSGIRGWEAGLPAQTSTIIASKYGPWSASLAWTDMITGTQPSIVVIAALVNDYYLSTTGANPVPSAQSRANIKAMVDWIKSYCTKAPSIVLCIEHQRNTVDGSMTEPWANYVNAAYSIASQEGYAVFDYGKRLGGGAPTAAYNAGLLNADQVHPSQQGHRYWGEALAQFLAPS